MEILVLVDRYEHWQAFLRDLGELWQYKVVRNNRIVLGRITYRVSVMDSGTYLGLRPDKVYIYNCFPTKATEYFYHLGIDSVYIDN